VSKTKSIKKRSQAGCQRLMPVILITVRSLARQIVLKTLPQKYPTQLLKIKSTCLASIRPQVQTKTTKKRSQELNLEI
jgi:hypothetical protein